MEAVAEVAAAAILMISPRWSFPLNLGLDRELMLKARADLRARRTLESAARGQRGFPWPYSAGLWGWPWSALGPFSGFRQRATAVDQPRISQPRPKARWERATIGGRGRLKQPYRNASRPHEPDPANRAQAGSGPGASARPGEPARLAGGEPPKLQLIVPAYFYPSGPGVKAWQRLINASSKVPIVVVANPSSGPGEVQDTEYASVIDSASEKGVRVIGYVNTEYAKRPMTDAKNEIDRWVYFYPSVAGFFFDQQSPDAHDVGYYLELRDYARSKIKGKAAFIVTNPGTTCDEEYFAQNVSDVTCLFATFKGFDEFNPPVLLKRYSPSRFAALPYQILDSKTMRQVVKEVVAKRMGYVYVSDAKSGGNPWGKLPEYWDDEVEAVRHAN